MFRHLKSVNHGLLDPVPFLNGKNALKNLQKFMKLLKTLNYKSQLNISGKIIFLYISYLKKVEKPMEKSLVLALAGLVDLGLQVKG